MTKVQRLRLRTKLYRKALLLFVQGYPEPEWMSLLHEEGCPGVQTPRKEERESDPRWQCRCSGDWNVTTVKRLLPKHVRKGRPE